MLLAGFQLASCGYTPSLIEQKDSAGERVDTTAIPDPVPKVEPITKAGNKSPYQVFGKTYFVLPSSENYRETGIASWYGRKFHGRRTSNGEIYNMYAMTAAHKSLPIPTYVRVTNLENARSVVLRVNDRGPFHPERLIDISYGAALQLGFAERGTATVLIESVELVEVDDRRELEAATYRYLQLGAYTSESAAGDLGHEIRHRWAYPVSVSAVDTDGRRLHRVRVGPFSTIQTLDQARDVLIEAGYPSPDSIP